MRAKADVLYIIPALRGLLGIRGRVVASDAAGCLLASVRRLLVPPEHTARLYGPTTTPHGAGSTGRQQHRRARIQGHILVRGPPMAIRSPPATSTVPGKASGRQPACHRAQQRAGGLESYPTGGMVRLNQSSNENYMPDAANHVDPIGASV